MTASRPCGMPTDRATNLCSDREHAMAYAVELNDLYPMTHGSTTHLIFWAAEYSRQMASEFFQNMCSRNETQSTRHLLTFARYLRCRFGVTCEELNVACHPCLFNPTRTAVRFVGFCVHCVENARDNGGWFSPIVANRDIRVVNVTPPPAVRRQLFVESDSEEEEDEESTVLDATDELIDSLPEDMAEEED